MEGDFLSTDADFNELRDKDRTIELVGYVHQVLGTQEVGKTTEDKLFKFTLSNGGSKKVQCLIWGDELISKYESELTTNKILHIDGAHCKSCQVSFRQEADNYVPFELIIQKSTVVEYLGTYNQHVPVTLEPQRVTFININEIEGCILIDGYIKTEFVLTPSRFENASYGCGSITDGEFKITIHIVNYTAINFKKGVAVTVIGQVNVNKSEPLTITCKDASAVTPRIGVEPLTSLQVLRGVATPKRKIPTP